MSEKAGQFRGATFGGFHRQDVLDYLEKLAAERKEEQEAWEAEKAAQAALLEQERSARARAENRLALLENRASETTGSRKELEDAMAELRQKLEEKEAKLSQAQAEAEELRRQIGKLAPEAQSWQRIKDTAGDIEAAMELVKRYEAKKGLSMYAFPVIGDYSCDDADTAHADAMWINKKVADSSTFTLINLLL